GQLDKGVRVGRQRLVQRAPVEGQQLAVVQRPDAGGARLFGDQRHLAEEVVRAEEGDGDRVAGRFLDVHLASPRLDHEHRVAGVALVDDDRSSGGRSRRQPSRQRVQDVVRKAEKDGDSFEDVESLSDLVGSAAAELLNLAQFTGIIGSGYLGSLTSGLLAHSRARRPGALGAEAGVKGPGAAPSRMINTLLAAPPFPWL